MIPALLFVSGATGLAYEVLWARDFALLYGSTASGTAVVLAAYFSGLALGAWLGGRWFADDDLHYRVEHGLSRYARLEAGIALAVLAYFVIRPSLPALVASITRDAPAAFIPIARAGLALALLLPTTVPLGATLPAIAATLARDDAAGAGRLYAWNTLGGVAGALAWGFVVVRAIGMRGSYLLAVALDGAVALAALRAARAAHAHHARSELIQPETSDEATARPGLAAGVAAVAGCVGLACEVLWTRGLSGVSSNSIYSVTLMLAAVLLGIVAGSRLAARMLARRASVEPSRVLATGFVALATTILWSLLAMRTLPQVSLAVIRDLGVAGQVSGLAAELILALVVMLPAATVLGTLFPLTIALAGADRPGRATGTMLAANTLAGVAGSLGAAFLVLPWVGLGGGLLAAAALSACVALPMTSHFATQALALTAGGAALVVAVLSPALELPWRNPAGERTLFYRDGATASVMVTADAQGQKRLRVNGHYSVGGSAGLLLERRQALVPLLLHGAPRRLLAIGVGTGDTLGAAVAVPGLEADGVELVREVLDAAALFATENGNVLAHPRARFIVDDGRSFLLASRARYDVILSELFLPWTAGTSALYTRELYELGRDHLADGGLYCQWLPLHQLAVPDLEAVVATFGSVFPRIELWLAYHRSETPLLALIGSRDVPRVDASRIASLLEDPELARLVIWSGLDEIRDLDALYVTRRNAPGSIATLDQTLATVPIMTDDRPRLEFSAPAAFFHQEGLARDALAWVAARLDPGMGTSGLSGSVRQLLAEAQIALLDGRRPAELEAYLKALALAPELRLVRRVLVSIVRERLEAGDRATASAIAERLHAVAGASREALTARELVGATTVSPTRP